VIGAEALATLSGGRLNLPPIGDKLDFPPKKLVFSGRFDPEVGPNLNKSCGRERSAGLAAASRLAELWRNGAQSCSADRVVPVCSPSVISLLSANYFPVIVLFRAAVVFRPTI
jgi:hypothetical protein